MSLFGNTQTTNTSATPATGGSIFGNSTTQQQQPAGGGLFGGQNQGATQTTPSLFGNTNQPTQAVSLFGNPSTSTSASGGGGLFGGQQQQQPQTTGGGLFGASNQPAATGGLFGSTTTQQPTATGGGLFGSTTQQQQPQQQSLFGGTNTTQQTSGGGLFGGSKPGGIFGSGLSINTGTNASGTTPPAPITTSANTLFGSTPGQQQQQQQQQPAPSGGLFSQSSQNQPQQRPSLFGNLAQSTNTLLGGSTLGTSTLGTSTLGTSTLGPGSAQPAGGLGVSTNGLLSTRGAGVPAQQQADAHVQQAKLVQRMESIYNAWNPTSPQCRFQVRALCMLVLASLTIDGNKHIFYNLVDPNQVSQFRPPPNAVAEVWEKATRENPDPTR